ncbi:MAG TPA: pyridoxamine 5'-phosphate oxidase [Mycobacteriales bacterium]|nr:pyridoxamine 5'-phosphate oxidase [Mycobacteriales bacterium]
MSDQLASFDEIASQDHGLCVLSMLRNSGGIAAAVVNAGVLPHPLTGEPAVGLVARGLRKLEHLRADPRATIVARAGWRWAAVEGTVDIFGPDDPHLEIDAETLRLILRKVFVAAGGTHDDWDTYDRTLAEERSAAVIITPQRTYPDA